MSRTPSGTPARVFSRRDTNEIMSMKMEFENIMAMNPELKYNFVSTTVEKARASLQGLKIYLIKQRNKTLYKIAFNACTQLASTFGNKLHGSVSEIIKVIQEQETTIVPILDELAEKYVIVTSSGGEPMCPEYRLLLVLGGIILCHCVGVKFSSFQGIMNMFTSSGSQQSPSLSPSKINIEPHITVEPTDIPDWME